MKDDKKILILYFLKLFSNKFHLVFRLIEYILKKRI